jgi:hypothetical protein
MREIRSSPLPRAVCLRNRANLPDIPSNSQLSVRFLPKTAIKANFLAIIGVFLRFFGLFLLGIASLSWLITNKKEG